MACGSCGGKNKDVKWTWSSADGKQRVGGLSQMEAQARAARLGGTATPG